MACRHQPNSVTGQIRAILAKGPIDTRSVAERFGMSSAVASSLLCQMRQRGEAVCLRKTRPGRNAQPALWGAPNTR